MLLYTRFNIYINIKIKMKIEDMTLEQIKTMLEEKKKKHLAVCKKHYRKKFLVDKKELTEEEKKDKEEKLKKRREYMNNRYNTIYKVRNAKKKAEKEKNNV